VIEKGIIQGLIQERKDKISWLNNRKLEKVILERLLRAKTTKWNEEQFVVWISEQA